MKKKDKLLSENAESAARLRTSLEEKEMEREVAHAKIAALEEDRKSILEVRIAGNFQNSYNYAYLQSTCTMHLH